MDAIETIFDLSQRHGKYPPEAYAFVFEVLDWISDKMSKRHLSGRELALTAMVYSFHRYGALARAVWEEMHIKRSEDLGQIVFQLVNAGLMGKQPNDKVSDFDKVVNVEEFDEVEMKIVEDKEKKLRIEYGLSDKV